MTQYPASDTAYIRTNPDCIGEPFIKARGEIFERIARIAKEMGTIAETASSKEVIHARKSKVGEWYQNVVSVLGERGSGKTILLLSTCACLGINKNCLPSGYIEEEENEKIEHERIGKKVKGDILLPIIQPEYFGPEDTLITWVLTYLKDYIEDKNNKHGFNYKIQQEDDDEGINPSDFIEEMRRDEALFSRKFSSHLAEQDVTAIDFQREILKVVNSQDRFMRNWRKLVNGLIVKDQEGRKESTSTDRENHPFLIIPIDDADLNPAALPVIMQQIQLLQHPNVLFLFSVNPRSLNSMMYISQLELNTNRTDAQPVVNFNNLIKRGLREVEDVRSDAKNKINKYLPHKYRVKIQPLSPKQCLDFKPLIKNEQTQTFVQLLQKIPMEIYGNTLRDISQFFDLTQSFKRCPLTDSPEFSKVCELHRSKKHNYEQLDHCWNPIVKKLYRDYEEAIKSQDKKKKKDAEQKLGHLSPPIPSVYADALPTSPRAMDQLYHIMSRWVSDIEGVSKKINNLIYDPSEKMKKRKELKDDERKTLARFEKEKRGKTSQSVKELLKTCIENIKLLPNPFRRRIKFIENPNPLSKHPILIEFNTRRLTLDIEVSGEGIAINTSHNNTAAKTSSHILRVHPITNYLMDVEENESDRIPGTWEISKREKPREGVDYRRVPQEYFAVYNLAYDLTSSVGVFDRATKSSDYSMREASGSTAIGIFSVQSEAPEPFKDCFCAMPRWYRVAHYNLFALAWNDLVRHIGDIVNYACPEGNVPSNHLLSDWVVLSLLRIHICIAMNYAPFIVTEKEKEQIIERMRTPHQPWNENESLLQEIKVFIEDGLSALMKQIQEDSQNRVVLKHQRAFRTWVEYGLPMLSSSEYVSELLGEWIANQWVVLLKKHYPHPIDFPKCLKDNCENRCNYLVNEQYGIRGKSKSFEEPPKKLSCRSCCFPKFWLIKTLLRFPKLQFDKNKHNANFFLQEFAEQNRSLNHVANDMLEERLEIVFNDIPTSNRPLFEQNG